jgi:hypothetical protein
MKNETNQFTDIDVDEHNYEEWEFDYTSNIVEAFLEDDVLPKLEAFDFENNDENYVQGMACFTLYTRLIEILIESGWTKDDLKKAIDDFGDFAIGTVH